MSLLAQIALLVAFFIVFLVLWLFLLRWRMGRAQRQVTEAFRRHGALSPQSALTLEELGVARRQIIGARNFKVIAVRALVAAGVVVPVEGNRFYLSEEAIQAAITAQLRGT